MQKTIFAVCALILFASCERAHNSETTKVTITTPASATDLSQLQNLVNSLNVELLNINTSTTQYLNIEPVGFDAVANSNAVNCYLVAVTAPEPSMNVNRCGILDESSNTISTLHTFGSYFGLARSNTSLVIDVPSGKDRQIKLFGFHATDINECKDLNLSPKKNFMSYPYLVGTSDKINLTGSAAVVTVQLENPTSANRVDGCSIEVPNNPENEASLAEVDDTYFPFNKLRIPSSPGFSCQQSRFILYNNSTEYIPTGFFSEYLYAIEFGDGTSFTSRVKYDTYEDCLNNSNPSATLRIQPTRNAIRRWLRVFDTDSGLTQMRIRNIDRPDIASTVRSISLVSDPANLYNTDLIGMPNYLQNGVCYPFQLGIRSIYGEFPSVISSSSFSVAPEISSNVVGQIYNENTCTNSVANITLTSNQSLSAVYYVKLEVAAPTKLRGYFNITKVTGDASINVYKFPFKVEHATTANPVLSYLVLSGFTSLDNLQLSGSDRCVPLTVYLQDQNSLPYIALSTDVIEFSAVPNRNLAGVTLYTENTCTTPLTGSTPIGIGKSSKTIFVKAVTTFTNSSRKDIRVKVNANIVSDMAFFLRVQ